MPRLPSDVKEIERSWYIVNIYFVFHSVLSGEFGDWKPYLLNYFNGCSSFEQAKQKYLPITADQLVTETERSNSEVPLIAPLANLPQSASPSTSSSQTIMTNTTNLIRPLQGTLFKNNSKATIAPNGQYKAERPANIVKLPSIKPNTSQN